jgi:formate hydrogenlyase transcriptional activator
MAASTMNTGTTHELSGASLRAERDRLAFLLDVTNLLVSHRDLGEMFHALAGCLGRVVPHEYTSISLLEPDSFHGIVRLVCLDGHRRVDLEQRRISISTDAAQRIGQNQPVTYRIEDLVHRNPEVHRVLGPLGMRWFCSLALTTARSRLGLLSVATRNLEPFQPDAVTLLEQAAAQIAIAVENSLAYEEIQRLKDDLVTERLILEGEPATDHGFAGIIGSSDALRQALQQVDTVAPTDATVLLTGETGTGKELVARAIHDRSARARRSFVRVNCTAIPEALMESEMFGHERGAFTGAVTTRVGRFELAQGGTLFLDEIGELPLSMQPKMLRALQEREFERVGSSRTVHADIRLVAATNRDLGEMAEAGEFRPDLYYRLNVFPIHLPPLRDRREDIPPLVHHFTAVHAARLKRSISGIPAATMQALCRWDWPGNIRELEHLVERAVILSGNGPLRIPPTDLQGRPAPPSGPAETRDKLSELERDAILDALRATNGVLSGANGAAARLGVKRTTLQSRMQKLGIRKRSY